jgi:hypothetical protein
MLDVIGGRISIINIYSGGRIKVIKGWDCYLRPKIGKFILQFMTGFLSVPESITYMPSVNACKFLSSFFCDLWHADCFMLIIK